jgi:hypothetical protein
VSDFNNEQFDSDNQEPTLVDGVRSELEEIDATDLTEHAARFEALHKKLQDSLNSIDGL